MSIERVSVDRQVLPDLLLDQIKAHMRVEHARDDALIRVYIAAAVGLIESKCNVNLDPAEYVVTGDEVHQSPTQVAWRGGAARWTLPQHNVRSFTMQDSSAFDAADITDDYTLWNADFGGSASSYLVSVGVGPSWRNVPSQAVLELQVGILDAADLAPGFFALIARLSGSMYENREASSALWADTFADELVALWRPSA
jgi:hypothetical protein